MGKESLEVACFHYTNSLGGGCVIATGYDEDCFYVIFHDHVGSHVCSTYTCGCFLGFRDVCMVLVQSPSLVSTRILREGCYGRPWGFVDPLGALYFPKSWMLSWNSLYYVCSCLL